jgi:Flp pilus assembly protein TadG
MKQRHSSVARKLEALRANASGTAALEFALGLPLLLGVGMWGSEVANLAMVNMQISQLAMQIADNGSRIGDTSMLEDLKIYESDINDLLHGAQIQAGNLDIAKNGRVTISSLQVAPGTTDKQYILWQRCSGTKNVPSRYGPAGTGLNSTFTGMGPAGSEITASAGDAVIFVEIEYNYQPLISSKFAPSNAIRAVAAFNVRDDRDISQIYQRDPGNPDTVSSCSGNAIPTATPKPTPKPTPRQCGRHRSAPAFRGWRHRAAAHPRCTPA